MTYQITNAIALSIALSFISGTVLAQAGSSLNQRGTLHAPRVTQQSVASTKPFFTAGPSAASGAIDATDLAKATATEGKNGVFQGTVAKVYAPRSNSLVILDFAADYDNAVSAVVFSKNYKKFPNLLQLTGKHVLVTGKFIAYDGRPEIVLDDLKQIKILF